MGEHGTKRWLKENMEAQIDAYWGSRKAWEAIPEKVSDMKLFTDWDHVVRIDHGYDESKPESELTLADMKAAARFRGGECLSESMQKGKSWNYGARAKVDPFFAQVWTPLHEPDEMREYPKLVSDEHYSRI